MDEKLTPELRDSLRGIGDGDPPGDLEDRVVGALRREGLIEPARRLRARRLGVAAAVLLAFAVGLFGGRLWGPPGDAGPAGDRYLLLLLEPIGSRLDAATEAERVREYSAWAGGLAQRGLLEAGEKLADESIVVGDPGPLPQAAADSARLGAERVTGFFIVRADTAEAARRLASDSPHVRHGGRVEVRAIEPT